MLCKIVALTIEEIANDLFKGLNPEQKGILVPIMRLMYPATKVELLTPPSVEADAIQLPTMNWHGVQFKRI